MTLTLREGMLAKRPGANLAQHPGFARTFVAGKLTVGLILPLESHPGRIAPTMVGHLAMARQAEELGFAALWMRDIPFLDPHYGDVGQIFEPLVYVAHLAATTHTIALGTAGVVLPLREPLLLAKQVTTIDQLSGGRMLLGLASGDRPSDYPLYGVDLNARGEMLREAFSVFRTVTEEPYPRFESSRFGRANGELDLVPKPLAGRVPSLAIGRGQQTAAWIAAHMDGLIAGVPLGAGVASLAREWQALTQDDSAFKPLGVGGFLDLVADRHHPVTRIQGGIRAGSEALLAYMERAEQAGIVHFAMNPKVSRRPYGEVMQELASCLLGRFPSHVKREEVVFVAPSSAPDPDPNETRHVPDT
jgi:luciferase-type oxidoreductase